MRRPSWCRHKLLFKSPQFYEGLNLAVRLGAKWYRGANPGDELVIVDTYDEEKEILRGEVVLTTYGCLDEIPEAWLKYGHNRFRDSGELYKAMCRAYAGGEDRDLDEGDKSRVTCILFTVPTAYPPERTESDILEEALDRPPPVR